MALLIALMVISSFDSVANANNWTIEGELNFYNAYYKDEPGLTGTVVSNISDAIDENTYNNFGQALQNLDFAKFKKVYIYYEVDGHNAYYFFMALGANGDSCQSFYTSKQIQQKTIDKCRDLKLLMKPQKKAPDQLIIHGLFVGLYIQEAHKRPKRFHVIDSDIDDALRDGEDIFDKIERLFNR